MMRRLIVFAAALVIAPACGDESISLRGSARIGQVEPEVVAEGGRQLTGSNSTGVPAWCEFVPTPFQNVACGGHADGSHHGRGSGNGCACQRWCRDEYRSAWQWDPECCGCNDDDDRGRNDNRNDRGDGDGREDVPFWCQDIPISGRRYVDACRTDRDNKSAEKEEPGWCEYVPVGVKVNVLPCTMDGDCVCSTHCEESNKAWWRYSPDCCGCEGASDTHREFHRNEDGPKWCEHVPNGAYDFVPPCSNEGGCACSTECKGLSSDFWRWNPECCACTGGDYDDDSDDGRDNRDHRAGHGHRHSEAAEWCGDVPVYERTNMLPCSGLGECECSSLCDSAPKAFWRYNPLCCGCEGAEEHAKEHRNTHHHDRDSNFKEPEWCKSIPEIQRDYAPQCSTGECTCAETCGEASPFQWRFIPECCGCQSDFRRHGDRHGPAREAPSWCQDVPEYQQSFMPQCTGGACACSSLCHWTPQVSWDSNPACCGCGKKDDIP